MPFSFVCGVSTAEISHLRKNACDTVYVFMCLEVWLMFRSVEGENEKEGGIEELRKRKREIEKGGRQTDRQR